MFRREVATARNLSCRAPAEAEDIEEGQHHSKSLMHVGLSCPLRARPMEKSKSKTCVSKNNYT